MDGCGRIARKPSDDASIAAVLLHRNILLLRATSGPEACQAKAFDLPFNPVITHPLQPAKGIIPLGWKAARLLTSELSRLCSERRASHYWHKAVVGAVLLDIARGRERVCAQDSLFYRGGGGIAEE
jgi:hypothetical protein